MDTTLYLDTWADQYERLDPAPDYEAMALPAHPDPTCRGVIVINHPTSTAHLLGVRVPHPSHVVISGHRAQSVWWLTAPVSSDGDNRRAWHTWDHVAAALAYYLEGDAGPQVVNLDALEADGLSTYSLRSNGELTHYLADLRGWLSARKLWTRAATFPRDARQKAGTMTTDAQTQARRDNSVKARAAARAVNRARGEDKARAILAMVDAGTDPEVMAERLSIAVVSVRPAITKARQRLGITASPPAAPRERPGLELEEVVNLLSDDALPSNVVPLPVTYRPDLGEDAELLSEVV